MHNFMIGSTCAVDFLDSLQKVRAVSQAPAFSMQKQKRLSALKALWSVEGGVRIGIPVSSIQPTRHQAETRAKLGQRRDVVGLIQPHAWVACGGWVELCVCVPQSRPHAKLPLGATSEEIDSWCDSVIWLIHQLTDITAQPAFKAA